MYDLTVAPDTQLLVPAQSYRGIISFLLSLVKYQSLLHYAKQMI